MTTCKLVLVLTVFFTCFSCNKKIMLLCNEATMIIKDDADSHKYTDRNFGNNPRILVFAWTTSGIPTIGRSLLRFDLSKIPAQKTIRKAILKLYGDNTVLNELTTRLDSNSNAFYIKKITKDWREKDITWNTQPCTSSDHQIFVPQSRLPEGAEDYTLDVTELINSMRHENLGILLQLQQEKEYSRVSLASNDTPSPRKPVLIIIFR